MGGAGAQQGVCTRVCVAARASLQQQSYSPSAVSNTATSRMPAGENCAARRLEAQTRDTRAAGDAVSETGRITEKSAGGSARRRCRPRRGAARRCRGVSHQAAARQAAARQAASCSAVGRAALAQTDDVGDTARSRPLRGRAACLKHILPPVADDAEVLRRVAGGRARASAPSCQRASSSSRAQPNVRVLRVSARTRARVCAAARITGAAGAPARWPPPTCSAERG
jgi:hypothetical protein